MAEDWGHEILGLVLRYDQNVLIVSMLIKLQNGLLYYHQLFHCPSSVECLGLDCKVEYRNANLEIMTYSDSIWIKYTKCDPNNTIDGQVTSLQDYTLAGLPGIRPSNFCSAYWPDTQCWPFPRGVRRLINGYYILKLKNMRWWVQQSPKICIVGLAVLTSSSRCSNWVICCILFLSEQLLDQYIQSKRMVHQTEVIAYGLEIIKWI